MANSLGMNLKKGNKLVMRDGRVAVMGTELFGAMSDNPGTEIAIEIDGVETLDDGYEIDDDATMRRFSKENGWEFCTKGD